MDLATTTCLFLDCQTTGLSSRKAELLELGWAFAPDSAVIQTRLIRSSNPEQIPRKVWEMTGLTADQMHAAHSAEEVWREVLTEAAQKHARFVVIHYAQFEMPFLRALHERVAPGAEFPWPVVCTYKLARKLHPGLSARTLRALSGFLRFDLPEEHRSHSHIAATQAIWSAFQKTLRTDQGVTSWDGLQDCLSQPAKPVSKQPRQFLASREKRLELPQSPGIYEMYSSSGRLLYIGKATCLRDRVNSYFRQRHTKRARIGELMARVEDIRVTQTETALEAALLENDRIKDDLPPYNSSLKTNAGRERPYESLERLLFIQRGEWDALDLAILNHPPEEMKQALEGILKEMGLEDFSSLEVRHLLKAGKRKFPTPSEEQEVLASVQRKLLRGVRRHHHRAWLCWLMDSTVCWQIESRGWRYLKIRQGSVEESGFASSPGEIDFKRPRRAFRERQGGMDLKTHDRMRILLTELSMAQRKGTAVRIGFSQSRVYSNEGSEWFSRLLNEAQVTPEELE